jgi:hypothetical protein
LTLQLPITGRVACSKWHTIPRMALPSDEELERMMRAPDLDATEGKGYWSFNDDGRIQVLTFLVDATHPPEGVDLAKWREAVELRLNEGSYTVMLVDVRDLEY